MPKLPDFRHVACAALLASAATLQLPAHAQPLPAGWRAVAGVQPTPTARAQPRLPTEVASDDGVKVRISDAARVLAGGDDIVDIMEALGLGARVHGAPERSVTASGRAAKHHFLFNRTTGAEGLLALDGTLFIGDSLRRHAKLAAILRATGLAAVVVDDVQPLPQKVRKVAAVFGLTHQGETMARALQAQLDEAANIGRALPRQPRVLHVSATGGGGRPTVGGKDTAAAQTIRLAGGTNVGDDAQAADYTALSNEGMVAAAPEIVLLSRNDLELVGGESGLWRAYPTLRQTPAGQTNRIWVMPDEQLKIVGTHAGAGAIALAKAFADYLKPR